MVPGRQGLVADSDPPVRPAVTAPHQNAATERSFAATLWKVRNTVVGPIERTTAPLGLTLVGPGGGGTCAVTAAHHPARITASKRAKKLVVVIVFMIRIGSQ